MSHKKKRVRTESTRDAKKKAVAVKPGTAVPTAIPTAVPSGTTAPPAIPVKR